MKKVLIGIGIVAILAALIVVSLNKKDSAEGGSGLFGGGPKQAVEVMEAKKGDLASTVMVTGTVKEVTKKDVVATSSVKVTSVLVQVGDKVSEGDSLYTVDTSSLEEELSALRLNREIQALTLEKIQNVSTTSSSTGAKISVELAKINLANAEALYDNQLESLEKNKELLSDGIISQSEYDLVAKSVDDALSQVDVGKLNLERSESDLSNLYSANNNSSKSLEYDVAIQLKNLKSMDLNIVKLEDQINELNEETLAPMAGVVTFKDLETGDVLIPNSPLLQIMDMDHLIVSANVREYDIRNMELGQEVTFTGDAIGDEETVKGKISYVAPVATTLISGGRETTGIEIKMDITEGLEILKPGYTVDCEIVTKQLSDIVIGDFNMFKEDKDGNKTSYVVVDGVLQERQVETGINSDFETEIVSGIEEGDYVVMNPSFSLKDGMAVEISNMDQVEADESLGEEGR